jgi:hypothetical protein
MEKRGIENRKRKKEAGILNNALVYGRGNCRRRRMESFSRLTENRRNKRGR